MEKRPLSLTIIAWLLILLSLLGLVTIFATTSNPQVAAKLAEMHASLTFLRAWSVVGAIVSCACAYGILKGLPWSRVLYAGWGVIGAIVDFYTSPQKVSAVIAVVIFVVVCLFLFGEKANVWFQARGLMLHREPDRDGNPVR